MSTVSVRRLRGLDDTPESLQIEIETVQNIIRRSAEQLFLARRGTGGSAMDDWLRAERQSCWAPQAELKETDTAFHLWIGVPGLGPEEIEVTLLPEAVILRGTNADEEDRPCQIHFSDFGTKKLFRRIAFPSQIHVDSAAVILDKSMLKVSAAKIESSEEILRRTASC
jgi:HSP20 family protein